MSSSENKYRDLLLISNDWIWEIDLEGRFTFTSDKITEILGYLPEEIIGQFVSKLFLPEERERLHAKLLDTIQAGKPIIDQVNCNLSKDGKRVYLLTNGIAFYNDEGKMIGYRGVDKDITSLKETEDKLRQAKDEAEKATHSKSIFLARMSHEIRTPMNGIIGTAELLKDTSLSEEQREFLEIIDVSANNLLSIINDILDISKIEAGKIEFENESFNLKTTIEEVIKLLSFKTSQRSIILESEIDEEIPAWVVGDYVRLKQILLNLTNNAVKFTKKGSVSIFVKAMKKTGPKHVCRFEIVDTGIGISQEGMKKLFADYTQTDASVTRKYGGTGLGLIISKKLTELMGGEISVESEEGKGSTFWFTLPYEEYKGKPIEDTRPKTNNNTVKRETMKILVAEDNMINQKVAMVNLKQLGHTVEIAVNGKMALDLYKQNEYDIILMDVQMPVLDGIDATKAIREFEQESGKGPIKIVAITANAMKEDREKCISAGMNDYITKPFKAEDLQRVLSLE